MIFNSISNSVPSKLAKECQGKFKGLTLELGVRKDNCFVGSGLGGNNFQLLVLMGLQHSLVQSNQFHISVSDKDIIWGTDFFHMSRAKMRRKLDDIFPAIQAKHKVLANAIEGMLKHPESYYQNFLENKNSFPALATYLEGGDYQHDHSMALHEQLLMAMVITEDISIRLDKNDRSRLKESGRAMQSFSSDIILLSVRCNIGIERLVKHNLDEHPDWAKALFRVNREVDTN